MLVLSYLILIYSQVFLVQSKSILPDAVNYAIAGSFNKTANILHVVIETDFDENKETFIDVIDTILEEKWNFRLQIDVNNKDGQAVSDYNLWFIDSYEAFRRLLPWIRGYLKDSQLFYFIVLRNRLEVDEHLNVTQKIFSDFLMLMIANVNVITETASGEVLIYTFYPYQERACRSAKPLLTHRFNNNSMKPSKNFFLPKADNFYGCPLRIRTRNQLILNLTDYDFSHKIVNYEMSVYEVIMVREFASRMNFSFEVYNVKHFAPIMVNKTVIVRIGTNHLMSDNKTDMVLGFYKNNLFENRLLTKSIPYYFSWLVICSPFRPNTLWMHGWLLVTFNTTTWIYTVVSFTLITGCIILARRSKQLRSIFHLRDRYPGGLEILSIIIGTSVGHLSKKLSLRFLFVVLSLSILILRSAYQGKLFDAYRGRRILKSPHSIKELFADNYTIYGHISYQTAINDLNQMEYPDFQNIESVLGNLTLFEADKKIALVTSYIFIYTSYTTQELKKLILEPVLIEQICIFFKQHSVIQPKINEIIMKMEEAGILQHMRKKFEMINNVGFYKIENEEARPLVLERFAFIFYIWAALCGISCLVFAAELLWHKFK